MTAAGFTFTLPKSHPRPAKLLQSHAVPCRHSGAPRSPITPSLCVFCVKYIYPGAAGSEIAGAEWEPSTVEVGEIGTLFKPQIRQTSGTACCRIASRRIAGWRRDKITYIKGHCCNRAAITRWVTCNGRYIINDKGKKTKVKKPKQKNQSKKTKAKKPKERTPPPHTPSNSHDPKTQNKNKIKITTSLGPSTPFIKFAIRLRIALFAIQSPPAIQSLFGIQSLLAIWSVD